MPIKPENRRRYPPNWPEIRERIRARSSNRCEWCGVENGAVGYREDDGRFVMLGRSPVEASMACEAAESDGRKVIRIVLTVAHVHDHSPENCTDDNLAHLCQRCHNRHDKDMRQRHAAATRREGLAISDLFEAT